MAFAIGAAVKAADWLKITIQFDDQAIGPRRRPGFQHCKLFKRAALQRFVVAFHRTQAGGDPVGGRHFGHHPVAKGGFAHDKFNDPSAGREQRQPCALTGGGWHKAGRIGRQVGQHRLRRFAGTQHEQARLPRVRHQNGIVGQRQHAEWPCQAIGAAGCLAGLQGKFPDAARGIALQQIVPPVLWPMQAGAVGNDQRFGIPEGHGHRAIDLEPRLGRKKLAVQRAADKTDAARSQPDGDHALMHGHGADHAVAGGEWHGLAMPKAKHRAAGGEIAFRAVMDQVGGRGGAEQHCRRFDLAVRPQRAIHGRHADRRLPGAAEIVIPPLQRVHHFAALPQ